MNNNNTKGCSQILYLCFFESIIFQSKSHALNTKSQYKIVFTIYCIIKIYFVFHFKTSQFPTLNFIAILNLYVSLSFLDTQNSHLKCMESIIAPLHQKSVQPPSQIKLFTYIFLIIGLPDMTKNCANYVMTEKLMYVYFFTHT